MADYLEFHDGGARVLIEVGTDEVPPTEEGVVRAGISLRRVGANVIKTVPTQLEGALHEVIRVNTEALMRAVHSLKEPPDDLEVTFGVKATGEVGHFAVGKIGGEVNYAVKLTWKDLKQSAPQVGDEPATEQHDGE